MVLSYRQYLLTPGHSPFLAVHVFSEPMSYVMLCYSCFVAISVVLLSALAAAQEFSRCRFDNGTLLPNNKQYGQYAPCAETGSLAAVCCALIRDNEPGGNLSMGATRDECLPNGICQNRWTQSKDGLLVTAYVCTFI